MKTTCLSLLVSLLTLSSFQSVNADEVRNGDFSEDTRFWFVLVNGGFRNNEAMAPFMRTNRAGLQMIVDEIPGEIDKPASVTLNQRLQTLLDGTEYVLRFRVKGVADESMLVGLGHPVSYGPDQGNLSAGIPVREIVLTEAWQALEFSFIYNEDKTLVLPEDARETLLQFRIGLLTQLRLQDISVKKK